MTRPAPTEPERSTVGSQSDDESDEELFEEDLVAKSTSPDGAEPEQLTPYDAVKKYINSAWPVDFVDALKACRESVGDAVFFASDFNAWKTRLLNSATIKVAALRQRGTSDALTKARDTLKPLRAVQLEKEGVAYYNEIYTIYEDRGSLRPYVKALISNSAEEGAKTIRTAKRTAPTPRTPETPGHEEWKVVISSAGSGAYPHTRLSMPRAARSWIRLQVTEGALQIMQALVRRNEGKRAANRDFGQLAEYLYSRLGSYTLDHPERVDVRLKHMLRHGRPLRNSPVHVRRTGDERVPWDNDLVIVNRTAGYAALVSGLMAIDDQWSDEDKKRFESVRHHTWHALALAALNTRSRVQGTPEYAAAAAAVDRRGLHPGSDALATLGGIRWDYLGGVFQRLAAVAEVELHDIFRYELNMMPMATDVPGMLKELVLLRGVRAAKVASAICLFGEMNLNVLSNAVAFALQESEDRATGDVSSAEWSMIHVGLFVELLITLQTHTKDMMMPVAEWEGLLLALAEGTDLEELQDEKYSIDERYKKRRRPDLSSDDNMPCVIEDPFVQTVSDKPGADDDDEIKRLEEELEGLEKKKALKTKIAKLRAELEGVSQPEGFPGKAETGRS